MNILKAHGKSAKESEVLDGYALNLGRSAQGMPTHMSNAKIACLDFNLQKTKMLFGIQVLVNDPKELERIREEESAITSRRIQMVLEAGANVILCTKGIDDMALKYFVEAGAIACRRVPKEDLKRVARATGAQVLSSLSDMDGNESFDPTHLGEAKEVFETRVSDDEMILIKGCKSSQACTMLLRGANDYFLDEIDRSLRRLMRRQTLLRIRFGRSGRRSRRIRVICSSRTKIRLVGFARTTRRRRIRRGVVVHPENFSRQRGQGFHRFSRKTTSLPLRLSIRQGRGQTLRRLRFRLTQRRVERQPRRRRPRTDDE